MLRNSLIKEHKKEILIGIVVAFFLSFVELLNLAIKPIFIENLRLSNNFIPVLLVVINLLILSGLALLVDKA